jgi:hypothetical protein
VINCDICQVANDDALLFCKDCGGRLKRPTPAPPAEVSPAPVAQAPQAPKPKLRSPILGGGSDEDFEDEPVRPAGKGKTKSSKGLRSPMLGGGGDDDFDEPDEQPVKRGKGGLRSPMLGGGSGDDDFDEPEEPSPKRGKGGLRSPILGSSGDEPQGKPKGRSKGGLRSPILGGAADLDDNDDDDDYQPAPKGRGLRSPILGGGDKHAKHDIEFPHRHNDLPAPENTKIRADQVNLAVCAHLFWVVTMAILKKCPQLRQLVPMAPVSPVDCALPYSVAAVTILMTNTKKRMK